MPSPSLGPPLLSASWSPPPFWGIPPEDDAGAEVAGALVAGALVAGALVAGALDAGAAVDEPVLDDEDEPQPATTNTPLTASALSKSLGSR
ncbi:MAG: hypothetical protein ACR2HD_03300 [Solirubrobacteraceae bacterium]